MLPSVSVSINSLNGSAGTLADYLGLRKPQGQGSDTTIGYACNALPFIMYHKIVDEYYRNSLITKPMFNEAYGTPSNTNANSTLCNLPFSQVVTTAVLAS